MTDLLSINIFILDDDEDDYISIKDMLREDKEAKYQLNWADNYCDGLYDVRSGGHHVCLLDYRLDVDYAQGYGISRRSL